MSHALLIGASFVGLVGGALGVQLPRSGGNERRGDSADTFN